MKFIVPIWLVLTLSLYGWILFGTDERGSGFGGTLSSLMLLLGGIGFLVSLAHIIHSAS